MPISSKWNNGNFLWNKKVANESKNPCIPKGKKLLRLLSSKKLKREEVHWGTAIWDIIIQTSFTKASVQVEFNKETQAYYFKIFDNTGRMVD